MRTFLFILLDLVGSEVLTVAEVEDAVIDVHMRPVGTATLGNAELADDVEFIGRGMVVFQYLFARYWFASHSRGPLESLWRKLTWIESRFRRRALIDEIDDTHIRNARVRL